MTLLTKMPAWDMLRQSAETWYLVDEPMEDAYKKVDMTKATIILNEGQSSAVCDSTASWIRTGR